MTDEALKGIAAQALNMARTEIDLTGKFHSLIGCYCEESGLQRMKDLEADLIQRLGKDWLNHGRKKDMAFGVLRLACKLVQPEAMVFVSAVNDFQPTEKLDALPAKQQRRMVDENGSDHLIAEGWLTAREALLVVAQSPERVCMATVALHHPETPRFAFGPQSLVEGRIKMFGEEPEGMPV